METFNEWMDLRSSEQPIKDWYFITEKGLDEAQSFLSDELFRDLRIVETDTKDGKSIVQFSGDPMVTLFELEELGITRA